MQARFTQAHMHAEADIFSYTVQDTAWSGLDIYLLTFGCKKLYLYCLLYITLVRKVANFFSSLRDS
jgi:hypothetical protein